MTIWANKYLEDCNRTIGHKKCNSEVSIKYYCKECDEYFDEKDLVIIDKHI